MVLDWRPAGSIPIMPKKKKYGRLFIRRSRIYHSLANNSSYQAHPYYNRSKTAHLRHRRIRRKIFNGAGDEKPIPSSSIEQKHIDFTELEHIFDTAIRNHLPVELYKDKPRTNNIVDENLRSVSKLESVINNNPIDTRIELSNQITQEPVKNINYSFVHKIKQHKILSAITFVTLSAIIESKIINYQLVHMTKTVSSDDNNELSSLIVEKCLLNKIDEDSSINDYGLITTINNNEVFEKIRPLKTITKIFNENQAHGDDTHIELSKDRENLFELFSHQSQTDIPRIPNEYSPNMTMQITNKSNEVPKTDNENRITQSYYDQNEKDLNFGDISLQQQRPSIDVCEYEIDLGNGRITKSISSYQSDDKQQQRTTSIISADSIQPITTFRIPFTNKLYKQHMYPNQETTIDHCDESNILFNSHDYVKQRQTKFSFRTITIFSIGTTIIIILMIVLIFLVF
ncbi:unnamed protein product [Rotaria sp. Silwood2]|nr:unnamed protein product [Rotaria sp. Silwood2]CAF3067434.1 unnamed protein product [Rotaria sp. Silwood2]CAF4146346.1 unnamed protein product [Rotaria sp. Silwood2]CAF4344688.1 unnamed protein product [Rotaria sp. Silwood2]